MTGKQGLAVGAGGSVRNDCGECGVGRRDPRSVLRPQGRRQLRHGSSKEDFDETITLPLAQALINEGIGVLGIPIVAGRQRHRLGAAGRLSLQSLRGGRSGLRGPRRSALRSDPHGGRRLRDVPGGAFVARRHLRTHCSGRGDAADRRALRRARKSRPRTLPTPGFAPASATSSSPRTSCTPRTTPASSRRSCVGGANISDSYSLRFEYQRFLDIGDEDSEGDVDLLSLGAERAVWPRYVPASACCSAPRADLMTTSRRHVLVPPLLPVFTASISSTTSMPESTRPKTA